MALDSFDNVKSWILSRAGQATDGTSDWDGDTTNHLIAAWRAIYSMQPWLGLRKFPPGVISTPAQITTTTIDVTVSTTALTLSAAPAASIKDYIILPNAEDYYLRVTAHTAASTSATIDAAPETLAAKACVIARLEYDLPSDCGVLVHSGLWGSNGQFIPQVTEEELWSAYGGIPEASNPPDCFARIGQTKIRFSHYPTVISRFEVPYIMSPADPSGTAAVALPEYLRPVWAEMALALLYEEIRDSRLKAAVARSEMLLSRAKEYETMLAVGLGQRSNERHNVLLRD